MVTKTRGQTKTKGSPAAALHFTAGPINGRTSSARAHPGVCRACHDKHQRGRGLCRDIRAATLHAHAPQPGSCRNTDRGAAPSGHARSWLRRAGCRVYQRAGDNEDPFFIVYDLLADLAHWCDRHQVDLPSALAHAAQHYLAETGGTGKQFKS
jgi:hypothetical protein